MNGRNDAGYNLGNRRAAALRVRDGCARGDDPCYQYKRQRTRFVTSGTKKIANDGDMITFAVTDTIGLTSGELLVNSSITISGPGANNLAVNGNAKSRVFHVASGKTVTISGLTITNGNSGSDAGGGIYNDHATLTLNELDSHRQLRELYRWRDFQRRLWQQCKPGNQQLHD